MRRVAKSTKSRAESGKVDADHGKVASKSKNSPASKETARVTEPIKYSKRRFFVPSFSFKTLRNYYMHTFKAFRSTVFEGYFSVFCKVAFSKLLEILF